jgi:hypothetical protein
MATSDTPAEDSRTGLRTSLALVGVGGSMMATSHFFPLVYGPYGQPISFYTLIAWNLTWPPSPLLLLAWPVAFGLLEAAFALAMLVRAGWARRWYHWLALAVFLEAVAALHLGLLWWNVGMAGFQRRETLVAWAGAGGTLVALVLATALLRRDDRRSHAVRLVGAAWVLVQLYPVWEGTWWQSTVWASGSGYWMLLCGTLLIAATSVRQLVGGR